MTNFFLLREPDYSSDHDWSRANPVEYAWSYSIPALKCSFCRSTWAGNRYTFLSLPEKFDDRRFYQPQPIEDHLWYPSVEDANSMFLPPAELNFMPGDELGIPQVLVKPGKSDIMFTIGPPLVTAKVAECLKKAKPIGAELIPVGTKWHPRAKDKSSSAPELFALNITSTSWRVNVTREQNTVCAHCKRWTLPKVDKVVIDETRWDGADIYLLDGAPGYIVLTEPIKELIEQNNFTNCRFMPVGPEAPPPLSRIDLLLRSIEETTVEDSQISDADPFFGL